MTTLWASVRPTIVLVAELLGSGGSERKRSPWPSPWKYLTLAVCLMQPCLANGGTDRQTARAWRNRVTPPGGYFTMQRCATGRGNLWDSSAFSKSWDSAFKTGKQGNCQGSIEKKHRSIRNPWLIREENASLKKKKECRLTCVVRPRRSWLHGNAPCGSWCRSPGLCRGWQTPAQNRCTSVREELRW